MIYFCCDKFRRNMVQGSTLNGIDFLEVIDRDAPTQDQRQRLLTLHFVNNLSVPLLTNNNFLIEGGERIRNIKVISTRVGVAPNTVVVEVDKAGDFSTYTMRLVLDSMHLQPPDGYDPMLSAVDFSFKVECPSDFDCKSTRVCPIEPDLKPEINYLAKDYDSFRRLMLDRMSVIMPGWREHNPADMGIAIVELLAYVGDYLSYQQDAVATEAYLGTARRRISVRRHALLVDYYMHNGCNARTWVQVQVNTDIRKSVSDDPPVLPKGTPLSTRIPGQPPVLPDNAALLRQAQVVFETMHAMDELFVAHNELSFYTWSDQRCCLPKGAIHATLKGHFPNLKIGEVLIFEEVIGSATGETEDADPTRRHAARLTEIIDTDANGDPLIDPLNNEEITEIRWSLEDSLPFPFCISVITDEEHGNMYLEDVSVARGNIVLADHGRTTKDELLGHVPSPKLFIAAMPGKDPCEEHQREPILPRFRPTLQEHPLTYTTPYNPFAPASAAMYWETKETLPSITLRSTLHADTTMWHPKQDLLSSAADAKEFVAEVESDSVVYLRFGDDKHGSRPEPQTEFQATYRVGNGVAGNIGSETLAHIFINLSDINKVRNPLPARRGVEPESIEDVRQRAPSAFRTQERAVTPDDYAEVSERNSQVQKAAATFRWTGSWHTVFLTVDRRGGLEVDETFEKDLRGYVERFRMAGYDLEVDEPLFVPLKIEMNVCAQPDYFRGDVKAALLELFSNRILPNGRRGVFHPDNFTFGQTVYLSPLYAAAQVVPGVASVHITKFERQGTPDPKSLEEGKLPLGRLEIARLDNDPNFPERGVFHLAVGGGK